MKKFSIVIAGGGSTYTPEIILMLLDNLDRLPLRSIKLYDNDEERQNHVAKACEILIKEKDPTIQYVATTDPEVAYTDVDFVLAHIRVGKLEMRSLDEKIPLKYGVVGQETCGPGGMAYGLRSIPGVLENIEYMEKYSPNAWMLNYSNPASIVAEACRRFKPNSRVINICDMPIGMEHTIARILGFNSRKEMCIRYYGLNHFGWWTSIKDKDGKEYIQDLIAHQLKYGNCLADDDASYYTDSSWFDTAKKVKDIIAIDPTMCPNSYFQYYLFGDDMVAHTDPNYTRADQVVDTREKRVFGECARIEKVGTAKNTTLQIGIHAEFIVESFRIWAGLMKSSIEIRRLHGNEECAFLTEVSVAKQAHRLSVLQIRKQRMERLHIALHMPNVHELLESGSQRLLNAGCDADRAGEICICSHTLPPGCPGGSLQDSFVIAADRDLNISTAALLHHFRDEADRLQESQKASVFAVVLHGNAAQRDFIAQVLGYIHQRLSTFRLLLGDTDIQRAGKSAGVVEEALRAIQIRGLQMKQFHN